MADRDLDTLITLTNHANEIADLKGALDKLDTRVTVIEKVLIIGEGDRKPLIQLMRDIETRLQDFMESRKKKDEKEEKGLQAKEVKEEENKRWWRRTLIVAGIGFFTTVIVPFLYQAFIFWTQMVPLIKEVVK